MDLLGDCFGGVPRHQRERTTTTPRNEAAFRRKTAQAPVAVTITPPSAGPTARAKFRPSPVSATASVRSLRGTASDVVDCQAGEFIAAPAPRANVRMSNNHGVVAPKTVSTPSAAAEDSIHPCVNSNILRRSIMSAMAPAGRASSTMGRLAAVCMSATITGDSVSEVISHAAPTSCIQVPMLEVSEAIQSARKSGLCIRAQALLYETAWAVMTSSASAAISPLASIPGPFTRSSAPMPQIPVPLLSLVFA